MPGQMSTRPVYPLQDVARFLATTAALKVPVARNAYLGVQKSPYKQPTEPELLQLN